MKKINKTSIHELNIKNGSWIKWVFIVLFSMLIVLSAALISFYFDVNKNTSSDKNNTNGEDALSGLEDNESGLRTFEDENGKTGVANSDGRTVIDAEWDSVYFLRSDRFIVSERIGDSEKMGIIDIDENVLCPFVFSDFKTVNRDIVKGCVADEDGYMVFDMSGNSLSGLVWDEVSDEDGQIVMKRGEDEFSAVFSGNKLIVTSAELIREIDGHQMNAKTSDAALFALLECDVLSDMTDTAASYFKALSDNDTVSLEKLTEKQFYSSMSENLIFRNCKINGYSSGSISANDDMSYTFTVDVNYDYSSGETDIKNIISKISLSITSDGKNGFIIKSINKTDL